MSLCIQVKKTSSHEEHCKIASRLCTCCTENVTISSYLLPLFQFVSYSPLNYTILMSSSFIFINLGKSQVSIFGILWICGYWKPCSRLYQQVLLRECSIPAKRNLTSNLWVRMLLTSKPCYDCEHFQHLFRWRWVVLVSQSAQLTAQFYDVTVMSHTHTHCHVSWHAWHESQRSCRLDICFYCKTNRRYSE